MDVPLGAAAEQTPLQPPDRQPQLLFQGELPLDSGWLWAIISYTQAVAGCILQLESLLLHTQ